VNRGEHDALDYLPYRAQVLYLMCLRYWMDFNSGIVGLTRPVTYRLLREQLEIRPPPQSRERVTSPTRGEVRASIEQLERVGLIERISTESQWGELVFFLPLATKGSIRLNPQQPGTATRDNLSVARVSGGENNQAQRNNTDLKSKTIRARVDTPGVVVPTRRQIPEDWIPSDMDRDYAKAHGLPDPDTWAEVFRLHNVSQGNLSADWSAAFRKYLTQRRVWDAIDKQKGRRHDSSNSTNRGGRRRSGAQILADGCSGVFEPETDAEPGPGDD